MGELNELLDQLAAASEERDKVAVLRTLMQRTTPRQMAYIVQIVLKNLRVRGGGCCGGGWPGKRAAARGGGGRVLVHEACAARTGMHEPACG